MDELNRFGWLWLFPLVTSWFVAGWVTYRLEKATKFQQKEAPLEPARDSDASEIPMTIEEKAAC